MAALDDDVAPSLSLCLSLLSFYCCPLCIAAVLCWFLGRDALLPFVPLTMAFSRPSVHRFHLSSTGVLLLPLTGFNVSKVPLSRTIKLNEEKN